MSVHLRTLIAAAKQDNEGLPVASEVDAVSRSCVDAKLDHTVPDRFAVTKISGLNPPQANADTGLGSLVPQGVEPFGERLDAVLALIP